MASEVSITANAGGATTSVSVGGAEWLGALMQLLHQLSTFTIQMMRIWMEFQMNVYVLWYWMQLISLLFKSLPVPKVGG